MKVEIRLREAVLKDFRLENIECGKYQLIILTAEEVLSKPFLFSVEKKKSLTVSLIGSSCVCFCRKTALQVFNLTRLDWLLAHFRKCSVPDFSFSAQELYVH